MASDRRLVPVTQPTALANQTSIPLPGYELVNLYVRNVHLVPGPLDVDHFEAALSKTLARYPHTAGRLVRDGDDWEIKLTNDPVPLIVERTSQTEKPFSDDFVIQPTDIVTSFTNTEDTSKMFLRGEGDEPLASFKLTIAPDWAVVGAVWAHTLGDANAFQDFVLCVSKFYDNLDATEDQLPLAPDFHRHFFRHPWSDAAAKWENMLPRMPHFAQDHDLAEIIKCHEKDAATTEEIQFRLSSESLSKMYDAATEGNEDVKISVQDAMSAYLTTALTQASKKPIKQLITVVNYRAPRKAIATAAKFVHPGSSSNRVISMHSERIPDDQVHSVPAIAKIIRSSINLGRSPEFVEKWQAFAGWLQARAVNSERHIYYEQDLEEMQAAIINSNYRFDWKKVDFGYTGQAKFHTSWASKNSFRVFRSNVAAASGPEPADVSLLIKREAKAAFVSVLLRDYPDTAFQGDVTKASAGLKTFWLEKSEA